MFAVTFHNQVLAQPHQTGRGTRFARVRAAALVLLAGLVLSGCATVRGSQDAPADFARLAVKSKYAAALKAYNMPNDADRGGMTRQDYRNYVIGLYRGDADGKYKRFKDQLHAADRGSALAGDLVVVGLTGATALAGAGATDDLATITAIAVGARGAIDKRLFFDRTMPAVIAAMDARRATIDARLTTRKRLSDDQYSLNDAINDLEQLFAAGDINVGVEQITADATAAKAAAEARLDKIVEGCSEATAQTALLNDEFRNLLRDGTTWIPARVAKAAELLDVEDPSGAPVAPGDVVSAFNSQYCKSDADKRVFIDGFKQQITASEGTR